MAGNEHGEAYVHGCVCVCAYVVMCVRVWSLRVLLCAWHKPCLGISDPARAGTS